MFNPEEDFINWKSLIDIKNYDDFYKGKEKRLFCNWTVEQLIEFIEKYRQLNLDKEKKKMLIESINDIIDFGLPYQKDFFEQYENENYYYKKGLENRIKEIIKIEPKLETTINNLIKENEKEDNKFNNCLYEKNQYEKIRKFIEKVRTLSKELKTKSNSEISIWAKNVKKYFKNKRKENNNNDISSDEEEEEKNKEKMIIPKENMKKEEKVEKRDKNNNKFKNLLSIFDSSGKNNQNTFQKEPKNQLSLKIDKKKAPKEEKLYKKEEIIAYINIGFEKIFNFPLRDTQLISLYVLINKKKNIGRIIQVLTGEGKTCIIIGLAIYHALRGHKVDIVTSNEYLAIRDSSLDNNKDIYTLFNLEISHCISDKESTTKGPKQCYDESCDIIYGDTHNFQADFLRDRYYSENTKNGRVEDVIIVDEIDSMLVDQYAKSTLLAGEKPYMDTLNPILFDIYTILQNSLKGRKKISTSKEGVEKLKKKLISLGEKLIFGGKVNNIEIPSIPLPKYLKEFAKNELEVWVMNAMLAFELEPEVSYTIKDEKIIPVDYQNTGVVQYNSHLSSGLHQFLEIKNKLPITPINIITNFQSNYGFFNLYKNKNKNNIYGLTGTLGTKTSKTLLKDIYNLDFAFIPPFYERKLIELCPRLEAPENWINTIIKTSLKAIENNREVLVICKSKKNAIEIKEQFQKYDKTLKIKELFDDTQAKDIKEYNNLEPGYIIIATNVAGRGTDINLIDEVVNNRGLHVCLTFLPKNERVKLQANGRAGRKGEPGTCQLILDFFEEFSEIMQMYFQTKSQKELIKFFKLTSSLETGLIEVLFAENTNKSQPENMMEKKKNHQIN